MGFPVYRKSEHGANWYKIQSADCFEEVPRIGSRYVLHMVKAEQYPELVRIQDMMERKGFLEIEPDEYESVRHQCPEK